MASELTGASDPGGRPAAEVEPSVLTLLDEFVPRGWRREELLDWPPDLFAFTSYLLQRTGIYRYVAGAPREWEPSHLEYDKQWIEAERSSGPAPFVPDWDPRCWPPTGDWTSRIQKAADEWQKQLLDGKVGEFVAKRFRAFLDLAPQVEVGRLSHRQGRRPSEWHLCASVLALHAVADAACGALGLPVAVSGDPMVEVRFLANLLLATNGTLSRLPKHLGIVLPKMRTPQSGLTLRSLSHQMSFHETEMNVIWRTMPWVN